MSSEITVQAQPGVLTEQLRYAQEVSQADILPDAYKNRPSDILVAMGFGQAMGLSPMESLYRINVIKGKPTMSAELIAAQVRKAGHKLRITKDREHLSVTATIIRSDDPDSPFSETRDQQWAQLMGLTGRENYRKQPLTMLTWRAITAVAREACPEALYGVAYSPDEMYDMQPSAQPAGHTTPAVPAAEAEETVPAAVLATKYQRSKLNNALKSCGVKTRDESNHVYTTLLERPITCSSDIEWSEAERLLKLSQAEISRKIREALEAYHAAAQQGTTAEAAAESETENE